MIAGLYVTKVAEATPRSLVVLAAANLILLSPLIRLSMIAVLRAFALWQVRAVVVGKEPSASQVAKDLEADWGLGYKVLRVSTGFTDRECLSGADEIVVVGSGYDPSTLNELVAEARWATGAVTFVPELSFLPIGSAASRFLPEKGHVLLTSRNLLTVRGNLILKRTFDLVISILILIPTVPVLVLIALAIRLSSRGPALYTQERVGKRGLRFRCMKFRTMHLDAEQRLASVLSSSSERQAEWNRYFKLRDDPRVTAIGRILRRTSLDELPQLLNILVGSMSLVGPRPLPDYHYAQIPEQWRSDYLDVLPGLTGAWQVSGRSETDLGQMGLLNSWYVRNWSLWLDITLLLRTIPVVLRGRGAY
jgi:undecaprenyl-phosphate galactose phosphotransferase